MPADLDTIIARYPRLANLRGKVADDVILEELAPKVGQYEALLPRAGQLIRTVHLSDVFPAEIERGEIVLQDFLGYWGNISIEELCKLCLIVRWLRPEAVFEIGTYNGVTTRQIALNMPKVGRVYTLDVDVGLPETATLDIGAIDRQLSQKAGAFQIEVGGRYRGTPEAARITQLWGDSTRFDFSPYAGRIDLVFVDAGHTYSFAKSDTLSALSLVRSGGVIVWHDYHQVLHPGVMQCLCEFAEEGLSIQHLRNTNLAVHYRSAAS